MWSISMFNTFSNNNAIAICAMLRIFTLHWICVGNLDGFKSTIFCPHFLNPYLTLGALGPRQGEWGSLGDLMQWNLNDILINVKRGPHIASAVWKSLTLRKLRSLRYYYRTYYSEIIQRYIWVCCISTIDEKITDWKVYHFCRHPVY